jgi:uncharacterized protein (TIGR00106 family)
LPVRPARLQGCLVLGRCVFRCRVAVDGLGPRRSRSWKLNAPPGAFAAEVPQAGAVASADCQEVQMLAAFSITPLGVGEGVAEYVADAIKIVRASGLPNQTDAMFTTIEGDWDEVMGVVKQAVDAVAARAPRVSLVLKADLRPGVTSALTAKVESVERHLRR